jgi:hypothetical protein
LYETEAALDVRAAAALADPAERFTRLQTIASRTYLSGGDQILLIERTLATALAPDQKADVLVTLLKNPSLSRRAKGHLLDRVQTGALPSSQAETIKRTIVDYPSSRFSGDEDEPGGIVDAIRSADTAVFVEETTGLEDHP